MERTRSDICHGLFRSATNIQAFENMLEVLSRKAVATGPADADEPSNTEGGKPAPGKKRKLPHVTVKRDIPKIGRNEMVSIQKGSEVVQMKFKKAQPLIDNEGWQLRM